MYVKFIYISDSVLFGVMIGENLIIGVGSVVIKDIFVNVIVVGNFCWVICGI